MSSYHIIAQVLVHVEGIDAPCTTETSFYNPWPILAEPAVFHLQLLFWLQLVPPHVSVWLAHAAL